MKFRKIDLAVVIDFEPYTRSGSKLMDHPFLKASRHGFNLRDFHKDQGKTLGVIATMAHALVAMGKNPKEARTYGMLIS